MTALIKVGFLVYNLVLLTIAGWFIFSLKRFKHFKSFEGYASIVAIALHVCIVFKILNISIIPFFIRHLTSLPINILLLGYWGGIVVYHFFRMRKRYLQYLKIHQFEYPEDNPHHAHSSHP